MFRHSSIYIRTDKGIDKPEDLKGKVVGVPEYQMTAALWVRGMLQDEYGVQPADELAGWRPLRKAARFQTSISSCRKAYTSKPSRRTELCRRCWIRGDRRPDWCPSALLFRPKRERNTTISRLSGSGGGLIQENRPFPDHAYRRHPQEPGRTAPMVAVNILNAFVEAKQICYMNLAKVGHLFTTLPWPSTNSKRRRN